MRILDLFCGAGGCSVGYARAGFDVVGVDLHPQPNYPYEFHQCDALHALRALMNTRVVDRFDAIHASPPCQMYTAYRRGMPKRGDEEYVNLIPETRRLLQTTGLPYVIENVVGAPLVDPVMLCGSSVGLDVQRHRLFETNWPLIVPSCQHGVHARDRFPGGRSKQRTGSSTGLVRATVEVGSWDIPLATQQAAMGIDWMTLPELSQAIPPAYTELIGHQLAQYLAPVRQARHAPPPANDKEGQPCPPHS